MTATTLGLTSPIKYLGAFVKDVTCNLGLAQGPSTCSVTLAEDENSVPPATFIPPVLGTFTKLQVGSTFTFTGVITKYDRDVRNISGRLTRVSIADVREIMAGIPLILAPGYRTVADFIKASSECSVIDVYGAFDSEEFGFNLSGWNQAGLAYDNVRKALEGGAVNIQGFAGFQVPAQGAKAFGEKYFFNLSEVTPLVNLEYRANTNLISMADFIQELATNHSFDWYVETNGDSGDDIEIIIKTIPRKVDNIDVDLNNFLAANSGRVITATSGLELRNEVACSVLLGAPVEQMRVFNINGMANTAVDLTEVGGFQQFFMTELEMKVVLGTKGAWEKYAFLVDRNYGFDIEFQPIKKPPRLIDPKSVIGKVAAKRIDERRGLIDQRNKKNLTAFESKVGRLYEILKSHAEANYGKRFLFTGAIDVDYVDAAWTVDVVAGNNDANEYFRNDDGKTRCYVEFQPDGFGTTGGQAGTTVTVVQSNLGLGIGGGFVTGQGGTQPLQLQLGPVDAGNRKIEEDKENYFILPDGRIFLAGTIEEKRNIVRLNSGIFEANSQLRLMADLRNLRETETALQNKLDDQVADQNAAKKVIERDADDNAIDLDTREQRRLKQVVGAIEMYNNIHAGAYQPTKVHVPTRAKFNRYGPAFSSNIVPASVGRLNIDQDDGFSPWEFGGFQLMLDAMQFRVDNRSSAVKDVQSANVTIEGFPQFSIGDSLGRNSNISSINISLSAQVATTYQLQSFQRKFGELTKEELATLSLFARRGGARNIPQDTVGFIEKYRTRVNTQFSGRGNRNTSGLSGGAFSFE